LVSESVISVRGLHKSYGDFEAVRGLDLDVKAGEVFAFLGPNGAGKTTTTEILEGYRERSAGDVAVLGEDPGQADREWRERIGIVLQQCRMRPELTVQETLELYAGYYRDPSSVDETIEHIGLGEKADTRAGGLSGGQLRRLDVGVALIGNPDLLFLDEPTTGFDPTARRQFWGLISGLRQLGKSVFLTTHYMEEAQVLADRVAIVSAGQIVAEGRPDELGGRATRDATIRFRIPNGTRLPDGFEAKPTANGELVISTPAPVEPLNRLTGWALENGVDLDGLQVTRPNLEDIYIELTKEVDSEA
jgi:ABC-2 type transport system ATP-binding protein